MLIRACLAAAALCAAVLTPALAQEGERRPSHCIALVENTPGLRVVPAAFDGAALAVRPASYTAPVEAEAGEVETDAAVLSVYFLRFDLGE